MTTTLTPDDDRFDFDPDDLFIELPEDRVALAPKPKSADKRAIEPDVGDSRKGSA